MSQLYVVCNQLDQYWGKKKRWVDGREPKTVMALKHEDEAINQLVELSSRDIELRGRVRAVPVNDKGLVQVEPSDHLIEEEPLPTEAPDASEDESGES